MSFYDTVKEMLGPTRHDTLRTLSRKLLEMGEEEEARSMMSDRNGQKSLDACARMVERHAANNGYTGILEELEFEGFIYPGSYSNDQGGF